MIALDQPIYDLKGRQLTDAGEPLTVRAVLIGALLNAPDQDGISGKDKALRFKLAQVTSLAKAHIHYSIDDKNMLMDVVGKSFSTLVVGRVYAILDPPEQQAEVAAAG